MFTRARQAEVIRCNQKDEYYLSYVRGSVTDIIQSLLGTQSWLRWRKEFDVLSDVLYFGLTTVAGYQTIGEEYVNILEVDSGLRRIPSTLRRALMVLLKVLTPYCLDWCLALLQRRLQAAGGTTPDRPVSGGVVSGSGGVVSERTREVLLANIQRLRHVVSVLHRCHLAVFYINGVYYHLAKRITGINYIQVRRGASNTSVSNYRLLGYLLALQISFTFIQQTWHHLTSTYTNTQPLVGPSLPHRLEDSDRIGGDETSEMSRSTGLVDARSRCALCLARRKQSTATPCGHLYCWDCILEWCSNKSECPLCRESFEPSRLIYLQNYDSLDK